MWFDDEKKHTCLDCDYGKRDCCECEQCIASRCEKGVAYTMWQPKSYSKAEVLLYDLFVQWHSRFGKILAFCKRHLLDIEKRTSGDC